MSEDALILVVEDDARLRGQLSRYLSDNGFRVSTAGDAAAARRPNEILSREDSGEALGMDESGERAIDVQVTRLRRKIETDPREPRFLHTARGRGYVLKPGS